MTAQTQNKHSKNNQTLTITVNNKPVALHKEINHDKAIPGETQGLQHTTCHAARSPAPVTFVFYVNAIGSQDVTLNRPGSTSIGKLNVNGALQTDCLVLSW